MLYNNSLLAEKLEGKGQEAMYLLLSSSHPLPDGRDRVLRPVALDA